MLSGPLFCTAALVAVNFGLAFVRIYGGRVQLEIEEEAKAYHPGLSVSWTLQLSSPDLQDKFHNWMDQMSAVRWSAWLILGLHAVSPAHYMHRNECGWLHILVMHLPGVVLAASRVALQMSGRNKQVQSLLSILSVTYLYVMILTYQAVKDRCVASFGLGWTSLEGIALYASMSILTDHIITQCTMQHFPAFFLLTWINTVALMYIQHLQGNGIESDPELFVLFAIASGTLLSLLVIAGFRLYLARKLMIAFLQSIRRD